MSAFLRYFNWLWQLLNNPQTDAVNLAEKESDRAKMLASPWLSFWECWEYSFPTGSLGIWGALTPTNGTMSHKKQEQCWKKKSFSISPSRSLCIWIFCCSSSQFLSTKKGFTWYGDYTDKKQNTKTSSISLGEITVICRQNPQITTYNHCQVYTATLLSFSRPFSFLNTEQWCSTMQVKSFKAMGHNFGLFGHRNTAWPRHKLPNRFSLDIWEGIFQRASFTVMHLCSYSRIVKPALTFRGTQ